MNWAWVLIWLLLIQWLHPWSTQIFTSFVTEVGLSFPLSGRLLVNGSRCLVGVSLMGANDWSFLKCVWMGKEPELRKLAYLIFLSLFPLSCQKSVWKTYTLDFTWNDRLTSILERKRESLDPRSQTLGVYFNCSYFSKPILDAPIWTVNMQAAKETWLTTSILPLAPSKSDSSL